MRHTTRTLAAGSALGLLLALGAGVPGVPAPWGGAPALAQAASGGSGADPTEIVRERNETVRRILDDAGDPVDDATRERLKDVINGLMDFRELSRRALGPHWDDRTEAEKREFVDVFRQLIRNSSVKKLGVYRADSITYRPPEIDDGEATVTTLAHQGRKRVEIVYRMHRVDGEWKAYDMVIDGASTARSYRDSFHRQITETSWEDTFQRLVRKLEEQQSEQTSS